jgi:TolA-binding protein
MQAYLGRADALNSLADYGGAVKVYTEALDKLSSVSVPGEIADRLHYNLAWVYLKQGEFKEAIKEFKKIVKETGDKIIKVIALCQIGDAYQDSGDYLRAQEAYDSILKDYPDSFYSDYVQYQVGLTMLKSSNYDGAVLAFLTLKRNYPQSKLLDDATYALGSAYFQKQDYRSSKDTFEKFQDEFKDSGLKPQAMYLLGASLYNLEKFPEAIEVFKDITKLYAQNRELLQKAEYEIADCYSQMGNEGEAITRFKQLRSKYPDSGLTAEIMWWLGEYYYRHNDLDSARRYFSSLIRDFPKSNLIPDTYYALGSCYEEEGKHEEALANFKKVIELTRSDLTGQAAITIADIYVKQDKSDMAIKTYQDIIKAFPNLTHLIYPKIADLYYKMNNLDEALEFYRKSLDVVPVREMSGIQFKIAEVKDTQGKPDEAVGEYLKVTYVYPENSAMVTKALLRVGAIYENKEKFKEALNIYNKVISMDVPEAKFAKERINWIESHTK